MKIIKVENCVGCLYAKSNGFLGGACCSVEKIDFIPLMGIHPSCPLPDSPVEISREGWIPVSDTKHRPVITEISNNTFQINVLVGGGEKGVRQYTQKSSSREELAIFFEEDSELKHSGFTHWQPLPEPPKEG
jgi:hypothetical protein